ncbi:MAG: hypothetical protein RQ745_10695 [Longimicrobiales bacterium]|nr:hypothetical protein [Longimicrobiales bacterium]
MDIEKYLDPARTTRRVITMGLMLGGAVAGAVVGVAITPLGKIVAGAPPAEMANLIWNAAAFGVMGACAAPLVAWSALRRVPLWRTIAEPLAGAIAGAGIGVLLGSGTAFLTLIPIGGAAAAARLAISYTDPPASALHSPSDLLQDARGDQTR